MQDELERLKAEIQSLAGYKAQVRWEEVVRSYRSFDRNIRDLMNLLETVQNDEEIIVGMIRNVGPNEVRPEFEAQLDRLLAGMLASAVTLVDHTRRLIQGYAGTALEQEHGARSKVLIDNIGSQFLRKARNYLLHYGQLGYNFQAELMPETKLKVLLDSANLLKWDGWGSAVRSYISGYPGGVELLPVVRTYAAQMNELYSWFFDQFTDLHGTQIDDVNDQIHKMNLFMTGGAHEDAESFRAAVEKGWRDHLEQDTAGGNKNRAGQVQGQRWQPS